jgi:Protein of unknown function (DUF2528)
MSNIKKFRVGEPLSDTYVVLEVDLDVLTAERAAFINDFVSGNDERLEREDGDVIRTAIRMFGDYAIRCFLADGGINLDGPIGPENVRATIKVLNFVYEGWPDFEALGIVIFEAYVALPDYDALELVEV